MILGARVTHSAPLRWGFAHRTELVTLEDGRRVVVKRFEGAAGAAELRRSVALADRLDAAGIPTPAVLSAEADADPPVLVLAFVDGHDRCRVAGHRGARAQTLAQTMGSLAVRFRELAVDAADHGNVDPGRTRAGSHTPRPNWLAAVARRMTHAGQPRTVEEIRDVIATMPDFYDATEPRLAHGDFVPVNVLLAADGSLAGDPRPRFLADRTSLARCRLVGFGRRDRSIRTRGSRHGRRCCRRPASPATRRCGRSFADSSSSAPSKSGATQNDPAALGLLASGVAQQIEP